MLTAAIAVNKAQAYASGDAMLICTGSDYKWVSYSAFFGRGETVFVAAPDGAPLPDDGSLDCGYEFLSLHDEHVTELPQIAIQLLVYQQLVQALGQRPYTAYPYRTALSRAPPLA